MLAWAQRLVFSSQLHTLSAGLVEKITLSSRRFWNRDVSIVLFLHTFCIVGIFECTWGDVKLAHTGCSGSPRLYKHVIFFSFLGTNMLSAFRYPGCRERRNVSDRRYIVPGVHTIERHSIFAAIGENFRQRGWTEVSQGWLDVASSVQHGRVEFAAERRHSDLGLSTVVRVADLFCALQ